MPRTRVAASKRLEPDPDERRRGTGADGGRDPLGGADGIGVLDRVAADAVAVLEVDPQVLDRLALELLAHARRDGCGDALVEAHRDGQRLEPPASAAAASAARPHCTGARA